MTTEALNLRYELRAYESPNCCRLAAFLLKMSDESSSYPVSRDAVVDTWAEEYPRHAVMTRRKSLRNRVGNALSLLKVAGMAQPGEAPHTIEITDTERLHIAAGNLAIVEDNQGMAVPPGAWTQRPEVPDHLREVQGLLEQQRQQAIANQ
jgi:hypothetical protein